MGLVDVHAHLTDERFAPDLAAVLDNARAAGLTRVICNGVNVEDNTAAQAIAAADPLVRPAYGLYPVDAVLTEMQQAGLEYPRQAGEPTAEESVQWVRDHLDEAIAIGEIGLDGLWVPEIFWDRQEQVFRMLVQLALDADKPIIVHTRKRELRAFEILVEMGVTKADFHCFGSKVKLAQRIAAAGYYLSIPAHARKAQNFTRMLEVLPRERILLETDCPYLSPDRELLPRNEPSSVALTAAYAAELWREPVEVVVEQLEGNFRALFGEEPG